MRANLTRQEVVAESTPIPVASPPAVAAITRIDPRAQSCIAARREFIELYRNSQPFGPIDWAENVWDVTQALQTTIKGYRARNRALISFTRHREAGQRLGAPFPEEHELGDVIRAFVCRQHVLNPVTALRQMVHIRAWRYLFDAMGGADIAELTPSVFNAAALAVAKREKASTAYTVHSALEHIADVLDELHLTKVKLHWRWARKKRMSGHGGSKQQKLGEASEVDRRASDDVVFAVAQLYHLVPRAAWADRVCVLLATILVCTGLRLGQVLCLRAEMPQFDEATGEYFIRLVPFKRADAQRKTLLSQTVDLLNDVFRELLELTAPVREVARWMAANPGKVYLPQPGSADGTVTVATLGAWFGLTDREMKRRMKAWGFCHEPIPLDMLNERLLQDRFDRPVVPGAGGEKLLLADSLAISLVSGMKQGTPALRHAVRPISEQHVSDRLRGRQLGNGKSQPNLFERFNLSDTNGEPLSTNAHSFRHKLNDALDKGGAPDLIQAQWFGRANPRDNQAYQARTPGEMRERAWELLIQGQLSGPLADLLREVAPERREDAAESLVQVAHPTSGGYCLQNFAQVDCEHSGQCLDDCNSFHWALGDVEREEELVLIRDSTSRRLRVMLDEMSSAQTLNDESFARLRHQLEFVNQILESIQENAIGTTNEA